METPQQQSIIMNNLLLMSKIGCMKYDSIKNISPQKSRVGRRYYSAECIEGKLCVPIGEFDMIEKCETCNKML
jgi:hypothetical protein